MENQKEEINQGENLGEQADQPMQDKSFLKGALTGALVVFILIGLIGTIGYVKFFRSGSYSNKEILTKATNTKMNLLRSIIDRYYLYDVNDQDLKNGIYEGYINGLNDPYSVYYDEEATKELLESTSGEYGGIGAVLSQDTSTGYVLIMEVYEDSPAEKAGLKKGDIIYQVDNHKIKEEDLSEIVSWIKGEKGTDVVLHVYRGDALKKVDIKITRAIIEAKTVEYEIKKNAIGYIQVSEFDEVTYNQFASALKELQKKDMKGLVIDLRSNPGGNVDVTCDMLKLLLPKGMIVYTEDKNGKKTEYTCDGKNEFDKPLAILVNGNSASASEIFTGAVQDYGVGTIVGTTTYGKGVVQSLLSLQDGTYLKLTIAEYFTPKGRSINKKGIDPDVKIEYQADEKNPGADNQLDKAIEVVTDQLEK